MSNSSTVTCSFTMDRDTYNEYKSTIVRKGENVKGNLINHMLKVINDSKPNAETIAAIKEAEQIVDDPNIPAYSNVDDLREALEC